MARTPPQRKDVHERALGLLAVRPRSRQEIERRLLHAGFESEEVADELVRLERVELIDDEAFARALAEQAFGSRKQGRRAVAGALAVKGVAPAIREAVLDELAGDEEERALELATSRASRVVSLPPEKAFQRLFGLLVRRGYSGETARQAARRALALQVPED